MRVAVVGSRGLTVSALQEYLPAETSEIVSGGATGVDTSAREYALSRGVALRELLPDYARFGRAAPLRRNETIAKSCDMMLAFWDGRSRGTLHVVSAARALGVPVRLYVFDAAYGEFREADA